MRTKRWLLRLAVASAAFTTSLAFAANVAVFTDTSYVDYDPGNPSAGASNLITSLNILSHTASPFTGKTASAWSSALNGKQILIVPEFYWNPASGLDAGVATVVQNFVSGGGHIIVLDDYVGALALATLLGWEPPFTDTYDDPFNATPQKPGSIFAAGPASLPDMRVSNIDAVRQSELPGDTTCAYAAVLNTVEYCAVFTRLQGSGRVSYLAWSWMFEDISDEDRQSWESVLDLAVRAPTSKPTPPTVATAVPTTSAATLAALAGLLTLLGSAAMRRRRNNNRIKP